jgi:type VI secretion system protein ImpG
VEGLLQGSAFLAARVQLNIDQQFRVFSRELLMQVCPDAVDPLPSAMIVEAKPAGKPADLVRGVTLPVGAPFEASQPGADRRLTVRYTLAEPITFWPLKIAEAQFHNSATALSALGTDDDTAGETRKTAAGLVIKLARTDGAALGDLAADTLPIHFTGGMREATALYEQVFARLKRVSLRWEDAQGDPVLRRIPLEAVTQIGFDAARPLYSQDPRLFPGFVTLLEFFAFPRKFLGMRLTGLTRHLRGIPVAQAQVIFEFDQGHTHLGAQFKPDQLALFCAPAVNLFEDQAQPVPLDGRFHRMRVTPNRTPATHYEIQKVLSVRAQYEGGQEKADVLPLYALPKRGHPPRETPYYALEKERRALSPQERRIGGTRFKYEGDDTYITFYEPPNAPPSSHLYVTTLCSNRHLPEVMPIDELAFSLLSDRKVRLSCRGGYTQPRESLVDLESDGPHRVTEGDNYWRVISLLSLSYRGFLGADGAGSVEALREVLRLFSDPTDTVTEAQISSLYAVRATPRARTVRRADGYYPARGIEVTLEFDDKAVDQEGIILLSAILDRFLADYAAVNSFTQTVVKTRKGLTLRTWPPRTGSGPLL